MKLTISSNNASNPLTLDLTKYIDVQDGDGMDPAAPAYSSRVISHSLLKPGGFFVYEDASVREQVFPLDIDASNQSAMIQQIELINQVVNSSGATASWQDDGLSQATTFDLLSGQFDVTYSFRRSGARRTKGNLRLFTQPFGRVAAPRAYAAASGVWPLLMISPYASNGALAIGASTQAGVAGFGGKPAGASTGIFYPGSPSLAGDAPAQLVMSYTVAGQTEASYSTVSLLPDADYNPVGTIIAAGVTNVYAQPGAIGGSVYSFQGAGSTTPFMYLDLSQIHPTTAWAGDHRVFALARASGVGGALTTEANSVTQNPTVASIGGPGDRYSLFDLGVVSLAASQVPGNDLQIGVAIPSVAGVGANAAIDVEALFMLPDSNTWFLNCTTVPGAGNTFVIDDFLGHQYVYGDNPSTAPPPVGAADQLFPRCFSIDEDSRGLVPQPDPKNGLPILAVLSMGDAATVYPTSRITVQVSVIERARYVLP